MEDLAAAQRRRYFEEIIALFPNGIIRLDKLCETIAGSFACLHSVICLATDDLYFTVGACGVTGRNVRRDRCPNFVSDEEIEMSKVTVADHQRLYVDRHGMPIEYLASVLLKVRSTTVGSLFVFDDEPRAEVLTEKQWAGLRAGAELGSSILTQSSAIRSNLIGLANLIVP
ncbi:hypothetical protein [Pelagovum sp. HNIBRBA483]|uniref:hypothetical protein n=1 Tax=Pelagovum sp. HNIBRBA483 TaxID=3233341 RepID=UPI0034A133F2